MHLAGPLEKEYRKVEGEGQLRYEGTSPRGLKISKQGNQDWEWSAAINIWGK